MVEEVKTLISRLEQDRQQTIRAYQREVERVKLLQVQVDKVERRRLYILPKAVQLGQFFLIIQVFLTVFDVFTSVTIKCVK